MADFPSNPSNGATHTIGNTVWVYNSTSDSWLIQDVTEYAVASLDNTPPSQPIDGTLWYEDSVTNRTYIFIDGDWVDAGPSESSNITSSTHISASSNGTAYTISHGDTSSISGAKGNTGNTTKIDQITVDANGHVTAVTTGPIGHSNTSNLNGAYGSNGDTTKIDRITVDANGHITNITTGAIGHSNTSNLNGTYGSTSNTTKINQITIDSNGHVTGVTTGSLPSISAGSGVGNLGVGVPSVSGTGTVTHLPGNNYTNVLIGLSGNAGGTWKCLSRSVKSQTFHYNDEAYISINYMYYGLYQRVS